MTDRLAAVVLTCAMVLAGCTDILPKSSGRVAAEPMRYSFYSSDPYQTVFIRILLQAKKCVPSVGISRTRVTGEAFEESASASILVAQQGIAGTTAHMPIEIVTENETTRITVQNSLARWDPFALAVRDWALHDSKECQASAR